MPARQYTINKPLFKRSYGISPQNASEDVPCQHVRIKHPSGSSPDLTLHHGPDNTAPIMAVVHIAAAHFGFKLGLGDPACAHAMVWEDMKFANKLQTHATWSMDLAAQGCAGGRDEYERRASFMWKKTRSVAADNVSIHALSTRNYKLVDEDGRILAVFTSNMSRGEVGTLQINVDYGRDFTTMVLMTLLALYERLRRQ